MASKTRHSLEYRQTFKIMLQIRSNLISFQKNKYVELDKPIFTFPKCCQYAHNFSNVWIQPVYKLAKLIRSTYSSNPDENEMFRSFRIDFDETLTEVPLLEHLEACNNTAFLVDYTKVQKWKMILERKGVNKISIGKDFLVEKYIGFTLEGWIPAFIVQRIKGVQSSGILEWWNDFVSGHLAKV